MKTKKFMKTKIYLKSEYKCVPSDTMTGYIDGYYFDTNKNEVMAIVIWNESRIDAIPLYKLEIIRYQKNKLKNL